MKRVLAAILIAMLVFVTGCQNVDDKQSTSSGTAAENSPTSAAQADGMPDDETLLEDEDLFYEDPQDAVTPEPTPIPVVAITEYVYDTLNDQNLGVSFKYPTHWNRIDGTNTICYEEPVEPGKIGARVSITRKQAGKITVSREVGMDQLTDFSRSLKQRYQNYKMKRGNPMKFAGNVGYCFTYTGELDGIKIKGYAALAYAPGTKNSFYLLHFSALADNFKTFDPVRSVVVKSVNV